MSTDKRKVQKYCRIFNWIQDYDEEFAEVLTNLCVERVIDTSKKHPSITFLMPKGKLRTEIIDLAYSEKPEKAVDMIISCVLPYGFPTIESFNNAQPNQIGNKLRYLFPKITNPNNKTVNFGDKLVIKTSHPRLIPRDNAKIYVWDIESGQPPNNFNKFVDKQEYVIPEGSRQVRGGQDCKVDPITQLNSKPRAIFAQTVEQLVRDEIQKIHSKNPYLSIVVLLLQRLIERTNFQIFLKVRPILDIDPIITFYILVEPYKLVGEYLVSDDIFNQRLFDNILKVRNAFENPADEYRKILNRPIEENYASFNNTKAVIESVNNLRNKLLNDTEARLLPEEILRIYNHLEEKNEIKGSGSESVNIGNIFPESLVAHYQNNHNKRLWQDEYRFIIGECLRTMKTEPDSEARAVVFNNLCNTLKLQLRGDNYSDELCIMNNSDYPLTACVRDRVRMMQYFVNSPDFLFIGCNMELICGVTSPTDTRYGTNRLRLAEKSLNNTPVDIFSLENVISNMSTEARESIMEKLKKIKEEKKTPNDKAREAYLEAISDGEDDESQPKR